MPDTVSQEELEALRKRAEKLREDEALALSELEATEAEKARLFEARQLAVEITRLEASANAARARADAAKSDSQTEVLDASLQTSLNSALAALENPQGVPVDTNSGVSSEPEKVAEPGASDAPSESGVLEPLTEPETPGDEQEPESEPVDPPSVDELFDMSNETVEPDTEGEQSDTNTNGDESTENGDESFHDDDESEHKDGGSF